MKTIILTLVISAFLLFPDDVKSQERTEMTSQRLIRDSTDLKEARNLEKRNEERMDDVKKERTQSKAKAKESQRISSEANDAAKESRQAVRAEKRAQKFREKADKQAQKAEDARNKSDRNKTNTQK